MTVIANLTEKPDRLNVGDLARLGDPVRGDCYVAIEDKARRGHLLGVRLWGAGISKAAYYEPDQLEVVTHPLLDAIEAGPYHGIIRIAPFEFRIPMHPRPRQLCEVGLAICDAYAEDLESDGLLKAVAAWHVWRLDKTMHPHWVQAVRALEGAVGLAVSAHDRARVVSPQAEIEER